MIANYQVDAKNKYYLACKYNQSMKIFTFAIILLTVFALSSSASIEPASSARKVSQKKCNKINKQRVKIWIQVKNASTWIDSSKYLRPPSYAAKRKRYFIRARAVAQKRYDRIIRKMIRKGCFIQPLG